MTTNRNRPMQEIVDRQLTRSQGIDKVPLILGGGLPL